MPVPQFKKALFIFRRDLRLSDNTGLIFALKNARTVIPAFIFTPTQIEHNPYRSDRCLQFMLESLEELEDALAAYQAKLALFYDEPEKIVKQCIDSLHIDVVVVNRDYTPYSMLRDQKIASVCQKKGIPFFATEDALLHPPELTLKKNKKPYTIFTPFFRNASHLRVPFPASNRLKNYEKASIPFALNKNLYKKILPERQPQAKGGRKAAIRILKNLKKFNEYETLKNYPAYDFTSHLSPHMKFTTCSIRETYHAIHTQLGANAPMIRSLFWRDFFTCIAYHFPQVFQGAFYDKFDKLDWSSDKKAFSKWCQGLTGFPIVDAGMREMNQTGFMHNRVRMLAASFLIKGLHIDWRWGERYFAQSLIDYDPAVNNGNWQWVASTGCDSQPYFRIFNPWTQSIKFDPECIYIKRWIPELAPVTPKIIHAWYLPEHHSLCPRYPPPLIDHTHETEYTLAMYKKIASKK